jgi:hypothetical protein
MPFGVGGELNNSDSAALEASRVIQPSKGRLYALSGINNNVAVRFIQIFDSATLPADGAVPKIVIIAQPTANFSADFGIYGRMFQNGIVVCNSTTLATKTIGAADSWFNARFL